MKWWFSIINAWNPLLINYCPWNLKNHLKIHVDCEFGVPKYSNQPAWAICCCCYIISKIIGYSKIGKIVPLQVVNFEIISSIWGAGNQRVGLTFLKLHFFRGTSDLLWEMSEHDWKNSWFTSKNSTNPKLPSQKSYIFRFRVNHISHTHSRPKSSIYYRRLSWNSACDSFGAWILKKVEIIIRDTGYR